MTAGVLNRPILICYDGSEHARAAIEETAPLLVGRPVVVATFWQPFADVARRFARSLLEIVQDAATVNEKEGELAELLATEGAELAASHGVVCEPRAIQVETPLDEAILGYADEIDAALVVLGSRGTTGLRSVLLGDVASDVLQQSPRPILVVPSSDLARRRRTELQSDATAPSEQVGV